MTFSLTSALFVLVVCTARHRVDSLILDATLSSYQDWILIGKFCFISAQSEFKFNISYPVSFLRQDLLLYYDDIWSNVYPKPGMSCNDRQRALYNDQDQSIPLLPLSSNSSASIFFCMYSSDGKIVCNYQVGFISERPRWWFIVIAHCGAKQVVANYRFEMTNGDGVFRHHFSADQFGILETSIALFLAYFFLILIAIIFAKLLYNKQLLHVTFKLFLASIVLEFIYFLIMMSEFGQFSSSGINTSGLTTIARIFDVVSQIIFVLMLILLAKGYTVTRAHLRTITKVKILCLFSAYSLAYVIAFIYSEVSFDPGIVNYFYNSAAGIAVICIKLIFGWLWFIYSIFFTIKNYPEKRFFYLILLVFFSLWFWSGPFLILACSYMVGDWMRSFVDFISQSLISFLGHAYFLVLTRPTAGNSTFPYHVKTNQITIAKTDDDTQNFPHHEENKGGNIYFANDGLQITDLFSMPNHGEKYQVGDATSRRSVATTINSNDINETNQDISP